MTPTQLPSAQHRQRSPARARRALAAAWTALLLAASGATGCAPATLQAPPAADGLARLAAPGALPDVSRGPWAALLQRGASAALEAPAGDAWGALAQGEAARAQGRFDVAADAYLAAVEAAPASPAAEVALVRLLGLQRLAPGWAGRAERAAEALQGADAGGVGPRPSAFARYQASRLGLWAGRERWVRSEDAAPFDGAPWGAPTRWRVLGPLSLYPNLDTLEPPGPAESGAALPAEAELLGFKRRTEQLTTSAEVTSLEGRLTGVYAAETFVTVTEATTVDVAAYFQGLGAVWIDGQEVVRRDDRAAYGPLKVRAHGVRLGPGIHRILVRVGVERGYAASFGLMLLPESPQVRLRFDHERPAGDAGRLLSLGATAPWMGYAADLDALGEHPAALYAAAVLAIELHEEGLARDALARLRGHHGAAAPLTELLEAELVESLWSLPADVRARQKTTHLRAARAADPSMTLALLGLSELWRSQELKEDATRAALQLTEARPEQVAAWMEAATTWQWRGLGTQAEDALSRALALEPGRCDAAQQLLQLQLARQAPPTPEAAAAIEPRCDLFAWRYAAEVEALRGDGAESLRLRARDVQRYPDRVWAWTSLAEAQRQRIDDKTALQTLEAALREHPHEPSLTLLQAELLEAEGRSDEAAAALRAALEEHPSHWELMRRLAALRRELPLMELMGDGLGAIKAWKAAPVPFPSAAVYVLDYMGRRYFEDGSSVDVTHLVIQVQNKEGIDTFGEVKLPSGAIPLRVRTIKQDGTLVEPEPTQGKPAISMPSLDAGDFIEYAYLTVNGYVPTRRGALVGPDFYFKMSNIASNHSELIVETPASWSPEIVALNAPPPAQETTQGPWRRYAFLQTRSSQPRPEPDGVENDEYLPHVQLVHRYTWADALRYEQHQLAGARASSPLLQAQARRLTEGLESERDKARALFDFSKRHVRTRSFTDFSTPAAHVLAKAEGNPVVLLQALLREVGIASTLWRIRPQQSNPQETAIPTLSRYSVVRLQAELDGATVWMGPTSDNALFDYLPEAAQGSPALPVEPGAAATPIETPRGDAALERREVTINLRLDAAGDLQGEVVEVLRGGRAAERRDTWDELASEDKLRKHVERMLSYDFSGAELRELRIEGREHPDGPLTLRYTFQRSGYARAQGNTLVVEDRYDLPDLTRRFARLPDRTVPMLLGQRIDEEVRVRLEVPPGLQLEGPGGPDTARYDGDFGSYTRAVTRGAHELTMVHRLVVPIQRVAPDRYEEFSAWTGDIDRATYGRIIARQEGR